MLPILLLTPKVTAIFFTLPSLPFGILNPAEYVAFLSFFIIMKTSGSLVNFVLKRFTRSLSSVAESKSGKSEIAFRKLVKELNRSNVMFTRTCVSYKATATSLGLVKEFVTMLVTKVSWSLNSWLEIDWDESTAKATLGWCGHVWPVILEKNKQNYLLRYEFCEIFEIIPFLVKFSYS